MKKVNGHEIISLFEQWCPKKFAMEGDPVGLHIGHLNRPVKRVLVTLDVNEAVIDEAIEKDAQLIIAHHPPLFRPLKHIWTDTPQGKMIVKCIQHNIAVYAAHTNLDVVPGGVNDMLAEKIGLKDTKVLQQTFEERLYKLIVFCPLTHAHELRTGLAEAGAGQLGNYAGCSYSMKGLGRFIPEDEASPFIGQVGKMAEVEEERIEVIVEHSQLQKVLTKLEQLHPYEEPAYDVIALSYPKRNGLGLGRVGKLQKSMSLADFAELVKQNLQVPALRFVGNPEKVIQTVAVLGGDGNKYIAAAKRQGADVLVTGDMYYHVAQDAEAMDLAIVDPGHHVEEVMKEGVALKMTELCSKQGYSVEFLSSSISTEPFTFM